MESHAAAARELYGNQRGIVDCVINDMATAPTSEKMKALLKIAGAVQTNGRLVSPEHIEEARKAGAGDRDIHDSVLIAATFSMFNRYVDGLGTLTPIDPSAYEPMGMRLATMGYVPPVNSSNET
jgi:alkylhydroperoxidase family enzyme